MKAEDIESLRPRIRFAMRFAEALLESQPSKDAEELVETLRS